MTVLRRDSQSTLDWPFLDRIELVVGPFTSKELIGLIYSGEFAGFLICRDKRQILLICRGKNDKKRQKRQIYLIEILVNN